MKIFSRIIYLFHNISLFKKKIKGAKCRKIKYSSIFIDDFPDDNIIQNNTLYIVGENGNYWVVIFLCPCGCGDLIQLNLLPEFRPRWSIKKHLDATLTLHPSIDRLVGCRSHFWIRKGVVEWVELKL